MSMPGRIWAPVAAALAIGYLAAMAVVGAPPAQRQLVQTEADGLLAVPAAEVRMAEIVKDGQTIRAVRQGDKNWTDQSGAPLGAAASAQLDRAATVLHRSGPVRELSEDDLAGVDAQPFGLKAPALVVTVWGAAEAPLLTARFGAINPEGILQYMRLDGSGSLYLMSRFVADEWATAHAEAKRR